jgi:hypothetical protein
LGAGFGHYPEGHHAQAFYQHTQWEARVLVTGRCLVGKHHLQAGDAIVIPPLVATNQRTTGNSRQLVVKAPNASEGDRITLGGLTDRGMRDGGLVVEEDLRP